MNEQKSIFINNMTKVALDLCTRVAAYVHVLKHAYAGIFLRTQLRLEKYKKNKFSIIMTEVWNESHIVWGPFQTPFFPL